jgi:hypothetical protein
VAAPLILLRDHHGKLVRAFRMPGVPQGSAVASIEYCAAQQPVLERVQRELPTVTLISIADDTSIHGPPADAVAAYRRFSELMLLQLNVELDPTKAQVLHCAEGVVPQATIDLCVAAGLPAPSGEVKVLGAIIASVITRYEEFAHGKYVPSITNTLQLIKHEHISRQNRLNIIRHCIVARVNYLARTCSPGLIEVVMAEVDRIILDSVHDLIDSTLDERINTIINQQIALPLRLGGLGIRRFKDSIAAVAHLSCFRAAAVLVTRERSKRGITSTSSDDLLEDIRTQLISDHGVVPDDKVLPKSVADCRLIDFFARAHGAGAAMMQRVLQKQVDQAALARLMQQLDGAPDGEQHKTRLKALQNPDSRLLYTIIPRDRSLRVPGKALQVHTRLRLGMKADTRLNVCTCGTVHTDTANSHVMRCSSNTSGWYHVHNKTVYALANIARAAGLSAYTRDFTKEKEEHHVVPDAVIMGGGQRRLIDVSFVTVSSSDYLRAKITDKNMDARSASRIEAQKKQHYQTLVRDGSCVFSPAVFERETLAMGPATLDLIDQIEVFSRGITAKEYQPRFTTKAKLMIAACIGNAELVEHALAKDTHRENTRFREVVLVGQHSAQAATLRGTEDRVSGFRAPHPLQRRMVTAPAASGALLRMVASAATAAA